MFKDETTITVKAGRGGDGCVSFRREAFVDRGGPDGGDGGRGGDVIFQATRNESSLFALARRRQIRAEPGANGRSVLRFGKDGQHEVLRVPLGTMVYDAETGELLCDLRVEGEEFVAAKGGKGGRGNRKFANATHQVPHEFEYGEDGEGKTLKLELRLIADVGLAGMPNAGKSTLLSHCSAAKPKIAAYPFTTLEPKLGIVERGFARFIMADIPGLIEGASEGRGLGHQFLRHIERTRVLIHLVDLSTGDLDQLVADYKTIRKELERFSPTVASKREILVGNKMDIPESREVIGAFSTALGQPVLGISGATGEGIEELMKLVMRELEAAAVDQTAIDAAQAEQDAEDLANETITKPKALKRGRVK